MRWVMLVAGALLAGAPLGFAWARARARVRSMEKRALTLAEEHERRSQARFAFLGSMAHELRTPLSSILGYQELLEEGIYGEFDERALEAIRRIGRATAQLGHLIDGMVELAAERPPSDLEVEPIDVAAIVRAAAHDAQNLARDANLQIEAEITGKLPPVHTDARRFERVLFLCLFAAIRATSSGTLRVAASAQAEPGQPVLLMTSISGTQLPTRSLPASDSPDDGGHAGHEGVTSLRLTIARATTRFLGGDLVLEPEASGSRIRFWIGDLQERD